ncbi:unnamed protein product [Effrenium voratum]|uniref:hydroxymethylglutaryl-CoA lyase n=1 Tax=Effrenium voratum TaxID=2562239 RepID=A0AA36I7Z6_9DINO|nr:unnamed protein product [Effrenium voratum]
MLAWRRAPRLAKVLARRPVSTVQVTDVSPRDGLQNETVKVDTPTKLELIRRLVDAGIRSMESTSFVNPKLVPQMADAADVLQACLAQHPLVAFPVLVPNARGLEAALAAGAKEVIHLCRMASTHGRLPY